MVQDRQDRFQTSSLTVKSIAQVEIFLDIPSYDKIVYSHLLKSPPLIEARGSPVVFPHRKPNAHKARMPYIFKTSSHEYITQSMPCPLL